MPAASTSSRRCLTWPLVGTAERRDTPAKLLLISAAAMASVLMPGVSLGGCQSEQLGIEAGLILGWQANLPSARQATNPRPTWRAPIGAAAGSRSWSVREAHRFLRRDGPGRAQGAHRRAVELRPGRHRETGQVLCVRACFGQSGGLSLTFGSQHEKMIARKP